MAFSIQIIIILFSAVFALILNNSFVETISFMKPGKVPGEADVPKRSLYNMAERLAIRKHNANPGQFPWMVALDITKINDNDRHIECGGSIISNRWILTAAHCVEQVERVLVIFGDINRAHGDFVPYQGPGFTMIASNVYSHPHYDGNQFSDIALLYMPKDIPFGPTVKPIKLSDNTDTYKFYNGIQAIVIGWGFNGGGRKNPILQYGVLPIISGDMCYNAGYKDPDALCTAANTGVDPCSGDSGGPLIVYSKNDNQYLQVGIVSYGWGSDCPSAFPRVFTRVDFHYSWIEKMTGKPRKKRTTISNFAQGWPESDQSFPSFGSSFDQDFPSFGSRFDHDFPSFGSSFDQDFPSFGSRFDHDLPSFDSRFYQNFPSFGSSFDQDLPSFDSRFYQDFPSFGSSFDQDLPSFDSRFYQNFPSFGSSFDQNIPKFNPSFDQNIPKFDQNIPKFDSSWDFGPPKYDRDWAYDQPIFGRRFYTPPSQWKSGPDF